MKRNEIIELNGVEYTLELNRQSAIQIEKYTNLQKSIKDVQEPLMDYVDEIKEDEDPFANEVDIDKYNQKANEKLETLKKLIERAFWIWLYPNHKLNINDVKKIIDPYFDDEEKTEFISNKYGEYFKISSEISQKYIEEQKNLKAQISK